MVLNLFGKKHKGHANGSSSSSSSDQHHHRHHSSNGNSQPTPVYDGSPNERRAHRIISWVTALSTLITFVLFLLVGVGLPVIKSIWLLSLHAKPYNSIISSIATEIRFGTWGYCAVSELNTQLCVGPRLGYSLSDPINIASFIGQPTLTATVEKALTVILVLHPICAGLAFTLFVLSWIKNHATGIVALINAILLAIVGSVSLAIDLALVVVAKNRVPDATSGNFTVEWGGGVWMVAAAVACAWLSVIIISIRACLCCGLRNKY